MHVPPAAWSPSSAHQGSIRMSLDRVTAKHVLLESEELRWFCPISSHGPGARPIWPVDCPAGYYCPLGTQNPTQHPCPRGTFRERPGARSSKDCRPCPAGQFCSDSSSGKHLPDGPCSAGYYCPPGQTSATPSTFRCPHGFQCPVGSPQPRACENGTFQPQEAQGSCEPCPAGYYCRASSTDPAAGLSERPEQQGMLATEEPQAGSPGMTSMRLVFLPPLELALLSPPSPRAVCASWDFSVHRLPLGHCSSMPSGDIRAQDRGCCRAGLRAVPSRFHHPCQSHTGTGGVGAAQEKQVVQGPEGCLLLPLILLPLGMFCSSEGLARPSGLCHAAHYCTGGAVSPTPIKHKVEALGFSGNDICPPGFFCPQGTSSPVPCMPGFYSSVPGLASQDQCQPCPPGHYCSRAGLSHALEAGLCDAGCPPGFRCPPGSPHELPCEPGSFSPLPGADTCLPCPGGTYCLKPATVEPATCPKGGVSEGDCEPCPAGSFCPPLGLDIPTSSSEPRASSPLAHPCPQGLILCPMSRVTSANQALLSLLHVDEGSTSPPLARTPASHVHLAFTAHILAPRCPCPAQHTPTAQLVCPDGFNTPASETCVFPYYCPPGSAHPHTCPGGTEALNISGLRVSEETCCRLCEAGTYRSQTLGARPCQPCPPGFSCHQGDYRISLSPGASHCTCWGRNRVFQKSDSSCICLAGHESYDKSGLENDESNSDEDCQPQVRARLSSCTSPQVAERCRPGDVRLAATCQCVSPQQHNCSAFCHPEDGELSAELGICQCRGYVSAEELCDAQCLAKAPHISLAWGPNRELTLSINDKAGDSVQRSRKRCEPCQTVPKALGQGYLLATVALAMAVFDAPLRWEGRGKALDTGTPVSSPLLQRHRQAAGPEGRQGASMHSRIPNPVVCLLAGDVILFQLHILPRSECQWQTPSSPLSHDLTFAHQFLDPGTYLFHDNGLPESMAVVLVKKGVACDLGLSPMQPSSPYQLTRHGILRHRLPNLEPDWIAITAFPSLKTMILRPLEKELIPGRKPSSQVQAPVLVPQSHSKALPAGKPYPSKVLKDFSVRTLYDKLEDQSLHVAAQLSQHRSDALAFYRSASQQLQGLKELLQGLAPTARQVLGRSGDTETKAKAAIRTNTEQSERLWGDHSAASQREFWPLPRGATVCPQSFQSELDRVTAALASALHHALKPPAGDGREASAQMDKQPPSACQHDPHLMTDTILKPRPLLSHEEPQSASSQQDQGPGQPPQGDSKGNAAGSGSQKWNIWAAPRYGAFPELQRKIQQVEDTLDELNEEFFQLSAQALELQKENKPGKPTQSDGSTQLREEPGPSRKAPGAWVMPGDQALMLEVRRVHLAERIRDLEWELSLLLQVSDVRIQAGGRMLSLGGH
ncbi:hypothetical protein J0S82_017746 [Galemys pyrenaicus]|uniref:Uncharacterized protein n=1 Tax=Galemys pyrenaicus TaxID=202257 RepID=A0A8J6E534_GALPY|nr:hypothetical protein J0S82_017746 [Galemys pyrenaicus]